jgi:hypothetical protein
MLRVLGSAFVVVGAFAFVFGIGNVRAASANCEPPGAFPCGILHVPFAKNTWQRIRPYGDSPQAIPPPLNLRQSASPASKPSAASTERRRILPGAPRSGAQASRHAAGAGVPVAPAALAISESTGAAARVAAAFRPPTQASEPEAWPNLLVLVLAVAGLASAVLAKTADA